MPAARFKQRMLLRHAHLCSLWAKCKRLIERSCCVSLAGKKAVRQGFDCHFLSRNQLAALDVKGITIKLKVTDLQLTRLGTESKEKGTSPHLFGAYARMLAYDRAPVVVNPCCDRSCSAWYGHQANGHPGSASQRNFTEACPDFWRW